MMELIAKFGASEYLAILGLVITALIGFFSVFYARRSYLHSLVNKSNAIEKNKEMRMYYNDFINVQPSKQVNVFLKKAAITSINNGVDIPLSLTDCLIKNYMENYFYLIKRLKNTWSYFEVKNGKILCSHSTLKINIKIVVWFFCYLFCGVALQFLIDMSGKFIDTYSYADRQNAVLNIIIVFVGITAGACISLISVLRMVDVKDVIKTIDKIDKEKGL